MKICVLGGAGFIGRRVIRNLAALGHEVACLDLAPGAQPAGVAAGRLDIRDFESVVAALATHRPDTVLNLVYMIGDHAPREAFRVNVLGMDNCFEAARLTGVDHVVYASSLAVHGSGQAPYGPAPITEDAAPMPRKQYATHKTFNEWQAKEYREKHGMAVTGVRVANVAGLDKVLGSVDHVEVIANPARGLPVTLPFRDKMRCIVHVEDIAEVFTRIVLKPRPQQPIYHSGGETFSLGELAEAVREVVPDARIAFDAETGGREGAEAYFIDNGRLTREFGIRYMPYRQRIGEMIEAARRG